MYWSPNFLAVAFVTSVTRMHDLASEFSKIFEGNTPRPSQREGKTPYCTQHPALPLARRGLQPGVWTQTLVRLNFSVVVASLAINHGIPKYTSCNVFQIRNTFNYLKYHI